MKIRHGAIGVGAAALLAAASPEEHHWSYSGATGPAHWSEVCSTGKAQSPIDIDTKHLRPEPLPPLAFHYESSAPKIIDNGHSIQVSLPPGSSLTVGGDSYSLVQFHFHHPSEESVDGKHFAMVAHLVHRDAHGKLAVVAVPLEVGAANPLIGTIWKSVPHEKGHEVAPAGVKIDAAGLLPASHSYYTFPGSLTTPPCSEGVHWFVLKSPMTLSADQLATFAKLYPDNARPVQPLNGRVILSSK